MPPPQDAVAGVPDMRTGVDVPEFAMPVLALRCWKQREVDAAELKAGVGVCFIEAARVVRPGLARPVVKHGIGVRAGVAANNTGRS